MTDFLKKKKKLKINTSEYVTDERIHWRNVKLAPKILEKCVNYVGEKQAQDWDEAGHTYTGIAHAVGIVTTVRVELCRHHYRMMPNLMLNVCACNTGATKYLY